MTNLQGAISFQPADRATVELAESALTLRRWRMKVDARKLYRKRLADCVARADVHLSEAELLAVIADQARRIAAMGGR